MISLNTLREAYYSSPLWLKNIIAKIPLSIREGRDYFAWKEFLNTKINEEEYEILKLKETITYSYNNVIYYKNLFDKNEISIKDINEKKDLIKIPVMTKLDLIKNINNLKAFNWSGNKSFYVTSGGSTGNPVELFQSNNVWKKELAFTHNLFEQFGYSSQSKIASFRLGEFENLGTRKYWKENPIRNEIKFSPYHINQDTIKIYLKKLNAEKPEYFLTYSSTILLLINNMLEAGVKLNYKPSTVFLVAEQTKLDEINFIKQNLNCEVTSFYGLTERTVFAPMNIDGTYTINKRYGLAELIDNNNNVICKNDVEGILIGTSFDNYAMPLLRYKSGDITSYFNISKSIINAIKGRENDYLDCETSQKISITSLIMHDDIFQNVLGYQYYQPKPGITVLKVLPKKEFSDKDKNRIQNQFNKKIGHTMKIDVQKVEDLTRTQRGKVKFVIKDF